MDENIELKKEIEIKPFRCPVCKGHGTVNYGKQKCGACKGKCYILVPQEIEEEVDPNLI